MRSGVEVMRVGKMIMFFGGWGVRCLIIVV